LAKNAFLAFEFGVRIQKEIFDFDGKDDRKSKFVN
jgi:hypothetical protein